MNSVIIFDVSDDDKVQIVRERMRAKGYFYNWNALNNNSGQKETYYLPHNIVWKPSTDSQQAMNDINEVINNLNNVQQLNITLKRCIVLNSTPWKGINGEAV